MADEDVKRLLEAMQQENAVAHTETRRHFEESVSETRRHFDVSTESLRIEIRTVAEGVVSIGENLGREVARLDEKIDRGFAETQAMIKFS